MKNKLIIKVSSTVLICLLFWGLHVATSPTDPDYPKYDPTILNGGSTKIWKLSQHYISMVDSTQSCEKDNTYSFSDDMKYVISEGTNVCSGKNALLTGDYDTDYSLRLNNNGDYEQFEFERYSDSLVVLKYLDKGLINHHLVLRPK